MKKKIIFRSLLKTPVGAGVICKAEEEDDAAAPLADDNTADGNSDKLFDEM